MTVSSPSRTKGATSRFLNWQRADWDAYIQTRDRYQSAEVSRVKLFFYKNALLVDDIGWEGINHAIIRELFVAIFFVWSNYHPQELTSMGGCLLEKEGEEAG